MGIYITADAIELAKVIKWVSSGVSKLNSVTHVRLEVHPEGILELQCNTEVNSYQAKLDVNFIDDSKPSVKRVFTLDGESLVKTPRILLGGNVEIRIEDNTSQVDLVTSRALYSVNVVNSPMSSFDSPSEPIGSVLSDSFGQAVKQVSKASSLALERNLAVLSCLSLEFSPQNKTITLTATDRFSLANRVISYEPHNENDEDFQILVNAKLMSQMTGQIGNGSTLTLFSEKNRVRFGVSTVSQSVQLSTDKSAYPAYKGLLKSDIESTVKVGRSDFIKPVLTVKELSGDPEIKVSVVGDEVSLDSARTHITIDECESDGDNSATFNVDKLASALGFLSSDKIGISFQTNKRRGVILSEILDDGSIDDSFFGLVIPMIVM